MGLVRTTPPAILPVTLSQIKDQLNLALDDKSRDARLLSLAKAATNLAERFTGRAFITQSWRLTVDYTFPGVGCYAQEIQLPRPPCVSITSIAYLDDDGAQQTLDASLYRLAKDHAPAILTPAYGEIWPTTRMVTEAVKITYVAGYGATADAALANVPEDAKLAILLAVQSWFDMPLAYEQVLPGAAVALLASLKVGVYAPTYQV